MVKTSQLIVPIYMLLIYHCCGGNASTMMKSYKNLCLVINNKIYSQSIKLCSLYLLVNTFISSEHDIWNFVITDILQPHSYHKPPGILPVGVRYGVINGLLLTLLDAIWHHIWLCWKKLKISTKGIWRLYYIQDYAFTTSSFFAQLKYLWILTVDRCIIFNEQRNIYWDSISQFNTIIS